MEYSKELSARFLKQLGCSVREIPTSSAERADLLASDSDSDYIVEVKERIPVIPVKVVPSDREGDPDVYVSRQPHSYSNRLDGLLKHGRDQLDNTPAQGGAFRLLWLHAVGFDAEMTVRRALYTFYGVVSIRPLSPPGEYMHCLYFDYSTAHAMPSVHGLVLMENNRIQLCINEFSINVDVFRKSRLVQQLGEEIYDPQKIEASGRAIALRSDVPRKDDQRVLDELERLTGVRYVAMRMQHYQYGCAPVDY